MGFGRAEHVSFQLLPASSDAASSIAVLLLPESPWYYARKHKHEKAKKALRTINGRVPGYDVEREYAVVQAELRRQEEESSGATIMDLFRRENIRRTAGATLAIAAQPLFGSNVFFVRLLIFSPNQLANRCDRLTRHSSSCRLVYQIPSSRRS
jgi:hypothetical protein